MVTAKEEFIELLTELQRMKGVDEITSKVIGILYIEPEEVSLEELCKNTGYSLSGVSTAMKLLVMAGIVKRIKKPKSKKVYFFMDKDMISFFLQSLGKMEKNVMFIKDRLPGIIEKYKTEKIKESKQELVIVEKYYKQLELTESAMVKIKDIVSDLIKKKEKL